MVAALSPDRKSLVLSVVNATDSQQTFDLNVAGLHPAGTPRCGYTGPNPTPPTTLASRPGGDQAEFRGAAKTLTVAPLTVSVYQFPLAR